ncbi:hypothetical protein BCR42DRAFT_427815 [Absidia repens]|uniref:Uncharacterized protein n=1 Tax=Absidia repens TaxID=90262 RepID=A0A1X2HZ81_9FUNG|nr:hypothetical protein BCR42DRAFT_427815 [Absidia repens]
MIILAASAILVFPAKDSLQMLLSSKTNSETSWIDQNDTSGWHETTVFSTTAILCSHSCCHRLLYMLYNCHIF